jgi:catechol 2,3-dioxygenase-like lactoylglutathione lyase family enzyme
MTSPTPVRRLLITVVVCAVASTLAGQGATPPAPSGAPAGEVLGVGNFIHAVSNLDRSLEFYHDVLGLDLQRGRGAPANPAPAPFVATPEILRLYNAVGGQFRVGTAMIAESPMRAELAEFKDVEPRPVRPRFQDPGATNLILSVRDIDAVMARVKKSATPVVTVGGQPVTLSEGGARMRAVLVQDPDGFFVELVERDPAPATAAPAEVNVIGIAFGVTVGSTDRMVRVFRDALGFEPRIGSFASDQAVLALMGTPGARYRRTTALVPGSSFQVEFLEFSGIDRKPVHSSAPHDPGSPVLRLRVRDVDSVLKALASTGVKVASAGGDAVKIGNPASGQPAAITAFPDNLFVQVLQQAPPR